MINENGLPNRLHTLQACPCVYDEGWISRMMQHKQRSCTRPFLPLLQPEDLLLSSPQSSYLLTGYELNAFTTLRLHFAPIDLRDIGLVS